MQITESADNVQAGISALIGGILGGLLGGLCCCLLQIFGGAISAAALRFQHGGPISLRDGAVIGALGGILSSIFGGIVAAGMSYLNVSINNIIFEMVFGATSYDATTRMAVSFLSVFLLGGVLGAVGGVIVSKIYQ